MQRLHAKLPCPCISTSPFTIRGKSFGDEGKFHASFHVTKMMPLLFLPDYTKLLGMKANQTNLANKKNKKNLKFTQISSHNQGHKSLEQEAVIVSDISHRSCCCSFVMKFAMTYLDDTMTACALKARHRARFLLQGVLLRAHLSTFYMTGMVLKDWLVNTPASM